MDTISADDIIKRAIQKERLLVAGANLQCLAVTWNILTRDVPDVHWMWTRALGTGIMIAGLIMILVAVSVPPRRRHPAIEAWSKSPAEQFYRRIFTPVFVSSFVGSQLIVAGLYWLSGKGFFYLDGAFVGFQMSFLPLAALSLFMARHAKP